MQTSVTINIHPGVAILLLILTAIWVYFRIDERD